MVACRTPISLVIRTAPFSPRWYDVQNELLWPESAFSDPWFSACSRPVWNNLNSLSLSLSLSSFGGSSRRIAAQRLRSALKYSESKGSVPRVSGRAAASKQPLPISNPAGAGFSPEWDLLPPAQVQPRWRLCSPGGVFLLLKSGRCNSPNDHGERRRGDLRKLRGADLDKDSLIFHGPETVPGELLGKT